MQNLEAGAAVEAGRAKDTFGNIETRGIDMIPEVERRSKPYELFTVFFGPQFGYGNMLFGALAIGFGLSWWSAVAAITIGSAVGSLVFLAVTPVSPKTGTNTQVSSGAAFGVRGRLVGSGITWFIAMGFFVILVYTAGQAVVFTFNRWWGTSTGLGALSLAMAVVIVVTCISAILGHRTLERGVRVITVLSIIVGIMVFAVFAGKFHAVHGGNYLLGSFWPTWFLAATTAASLPISWGPFVGDYGRYIPSGTSSRVVSTYGYLGIFLGCWAGMIAAAYAATAFVGQAATNFVGGMTLAAPSWFLLPMLLILGLASNIASAGMSLYNAALDMGSWPLFLRFKRWHIAAALSAVVFGLTYLLTVATNFLTNLTAFVTIMVVTATPWMVIVGVHYLLCRGDYAPVDLHAFAMPGVRGRYWYTAGLNPRAIIAWAAGVTFGLMFSANTLFTGPLVERGERCGHLLAHGRDRGCGALPGPHHHVGPGKGGFEERGGDGDDAGERGGDHPMSGARVGLLSIVRPADACRAGPGFFERGEHKRHPPAGGRRPRYHDAGHGLVVRRRALGTLCRGPLRARHAWARDVGAGGLRSPSGWGLRGGRAGARLTSRSGTRASSSRRAFSRGPRGRLCASARTGKLRRRDRHRPTDVGTGEASLPDGGGPVHPRHPGSAATGEA